MPESTEILEDKDPTELDEATVVPPLTNEEEEEAQSRTSATALVVHETIRKDGEEELSRTVSALAWSGLAAGLSMGFSFLAEGLLREALPDAPWRPLLTNLGYPLGFLLVIIGRQQLFTENTLTAVIPLLAKRDPRTLFAVLKLWGIVLVSNLIGAHLFAWAAAKTAIAKPETQESMRQIALEAAGAGVGSILLRGILAGWLIAMVVWMIAASDHGRIAIIVALTYLVGLASFSHVVVGAVEMAYLAAVHARPWTSVMAGYVLPALVGNTIGGVALVSALNHAQVVAGRKG